MLKLCVLAATLVVVICSPLQKNTAEKPHVRVKRTGEQQPVIENTENEEKRSRLGYKPDDVKQAEEDQSAVVQTEILSAEDTSTEPDVISNPKQETLADVLAPTEPDKQGDAEKLESALQDKAVEESLEELLENKQPEDLSESEEADLEKLISNEEDDTVVAPAPQDEVTSADEGKPADMESSSRPKGRYSNDFFYDLYNPFGYGRKRRAAPHPAATAEDMKMGGVGEKVRPGGRRIKRDLKMDELRTLLKRGEYLDDYADYPEYPTYEDEYPEYNEYEPYYDQEELAKEEMIENDLANLIAEELAEEEQQQGYDYPEEYPDYPEYQEEYEEYYEDPEQVFQEYDDYPEADIDDLTIQQKLALMSYLENREQEKEGYDPYGQYMPDYPKVEETYEDLGPVSRVYKRQYLSFVPGSKRSGQFYPAPDGWWKGLTDPVMEQKRNNMEYERLLRLAEALNGPEGYYEEYKKKK